MHISPDKENILKKIRKALTESTPLPFPGSEGNNTVFNAIQQEPEVEFAEQFTKLMGKFAFCLDINELSSQLSTLVSKEKWSKIYCNDPQLQSILSGMNFMGGTEKDLAECEIAITGCECLIARTGTVVMSAAQPGGRTVSVYAPIHICIAYTSQLVEDVKDGLRFLKQKYGTSLPSMMTFATGPSRTADIEKTLVVGVHGPKETYVFLVDDSGDKE